MEDQQITSETWPNYFNADGQILYEYQVRKCIFFKGIAPEARPQVWPFLLAVYPFSSTPHQRQTIDANNSKEYAKLCEAWQLLRDREDESYRKNRKIIDKDVLRTDRNHPYFTGDDNPNLDTLRNLLLAHTVLDPELGYVQGMNDILSPILATVQDEVKSFWCFVSYMKRMRNNFVNISMHDGLRSVMALTKFYDPELASMLQECAHGEEEDWLFCYQWLLLDFKREFEFEDAIVIWERIWAQFSTSHFHIFVALGIFQLYKSKIMSFHDLLELQMFIKGLAKNMNVQEVIRQALTVLWQLKADEELLPNDLKALIKPVEGAIFVPPPMIGFQRAQAKKNQIPKDRPTEPPSVFAGLHNKPSGSNQKLGSVGSSAYHDIPAGLLAPGRRTHPKGPQRTIVTQPLAGRMGGRSALVNGDIWIQCFTRERHPYYWNPTTNICTWESPENALTGTGRIPNIWAQYYTPNGHPYFYNPKLHVTQWLPPY
eukprot:m.88781 g.88781  ORF g.88781 m.88781 type:complete len:485 (+) comp13188_c0_seq2:357-1811(+)